MCCRSVMKVSIFIQHAAPKAKFKLLPAPMCACPSYHISSPCHLVTSSCCSTSLQQRRIHKQVTVWRSILRRAASQTSTTQPSASSSQRCASTIVLTMTIATANGRRATPSHSSPNLSRPKKITWPPCNTSLFFKTTTFCIFQSNLWSISNSTGSRSTTIIACRPRVLPIMLSKESTKRASKFFQFSKEEIYMSELDKAISELVSAFQEIMPSAQVFVAQAKPETEVKPNTKATGLSPEAEYWRQKYMNTLDKYNTLLAGQSIRTKTHDQERSTIANLQSQIRDLTQTVQRKNQEIASMKETFHKYGSEQRVAILNLQETVAELRERNAKILSDSKSKDARIKELYDNLQRAVLNTESPKMTTPLGVLPVNSTGMRRLADAYAQIASLYNHRSTEQSTMAEKNAALQKENDAYEALFRVLAETLREYDPKVKS
ncbi:MAG TPA: nuclear pore complex protein [Caudoviricetes sp.]|nr:MAG TPA: nuclear pore complex protein [Caudoviricetes sp.]